MGLPIPDPVERNYGSVAEFAAALVTEDASGFVWETATKMPDKSVQTFWVKPSPETP